MGIHLLFGRTIEVLADTLCERLHLMQDRSDPFVPATIIVPNRNLEHWLKQRIARNLGAAVNIRFDFLENGLWRMIQQVSGVENPVVIDRTEIQLRILAKLIDVGKTRQNAPFNRTETPPCVSPLDSYLSTASDPTDYSRRIWQLSGRLAGFFLEYENHREELIAAWQRNEPCLHGQLRPDQLDMELAQRSLYRSIFEMDAERNAPILKGCTLAQSLPPVGRQDDAPSDSFDCVRVFGLSITAPLYLKCLFYLGAKYSIELYELNACSEFWEDLESPAEKRWRRVRSIRKMETVRLNDPESEFLEPDPDENPLLARWGKLGREKIKLLSELEERSEGFVDFESEWLDVPLSEPDTLLNRIQAGIHLRKGRLESRLPQDTSIQIVGCPGLYREAEMVRDSIIDNLSRTPDLKLTDIAVLVPDIELYKPAILAMFETGPCRIPFSLSDSRASTDSHYARALAALLDLAAGAFTRRQFFELALNPCFIAGCKLKRSDIETWLDWAERLNVFRFWDAHHKQECQLDGTDRFTWNNALIRLRLGRIMQARIVDDPMAGDAHYHDFVPHTDIESQNPEQLSRVSLTIESLLTELKQISGFSLSGTEWTQRITTLLRRYLAAPDDFPSEETVVRSLFSRMEQLERLDELMDWAGKPSNFGFGFVREWIVSLLNELPSSRGRYLAGGVAVSALRPMRPVPFRIVYIMGLGEGHFPGHAELSTLDLRLFHRTLGDVCIPDSNRYLFLETLLSTREKLYLSYQSLDPRQDKQFHPCSIINELRRYLESSLLPQGETFHICRIPLNSFDPVHLFRKSSDERSWTDIPALPSPENITLGLNVLGRNTQNPSSSAAVFELQNRLEQPGSRIRTAVSGLQKRSSLQGDSARKITLNLSEPARFLRDPLVCILKRYYSIYETGADESLLAEFEPIDLNHLEMWQLKNDVLNAAFRALPEPDWTHRGVLARIVEDRARIGLFPEGFFGSLQIDLIEKELDALFEESELGKLLTYIRAEGGSRFRRVWFGPTRHLTPHDIILPSLCLDVNSSDTVRVELEGGPYYLIDSGNGSVIVSVTPSGKPKYPPLKNNSIESYLAMLALHCTNEFPPNTPTWITSPVSEFGGLDCCFKDAVTHVRWSADPSIAGNVLRSVLSDFLTVPPEFDLLPFDILWPAWIKTQPVMDTDPNRFRDVVRDLLDSQPVREFGGYELPTLACVSRSVRIPADALSKAQRRLGHLFNAAMTSGVDSGSSGDSSYAD